MSRSIFSPDTLIFVGSFIGFVLGAILLVTVIDLPGQEPAEIVSSTPTPTETQIPKDTPTETPAPTEILASAEPLETPTLPPSPTATQLVASTPTETLTPIITPTQPVASPTPTETLAPTVTPTQPAASPTPTETLAPTITPTQPAASPTPTEPPEPTPTETSSSIPTATSAPVVKVPNLPSASTIIYVQSNYQGHHLALVKPDGSLLNQELHRYAAAPAWSPDGTKIAFFGKPGISQLGGAYISDAGIWLIDSQGGNPQQLISIDRVKNLNWSPDSTKIAFEVEAPNGTADIIIIDAQGGQLMHRYPGAQPTWSPDSQKLAVKTCAPACGLWQVNFDGSEAKPLTTDGTDSYPTWSPTGQFLAFTSRRDGNWEIYLLRLDDNSLQRLTNRPATDVTPIFSPNGQEIYLRTDDQGGGDAWRITAITIDGSSERLVKEGVGPSDDWGLARPAIR
jgi:hypothetical protein